MALRIKNGKVVNVPPPKISKKKLKEMENAPIDEEMIKKATSRKYNIVTA